MTTTVTLGSFIKVQWRIQNFPDRSVNLLFRQFFLPKTAWQWKNWILKGHHRRLLPMDSPMMCDDNKDKDGKSIKILVTTTKYLNKNCHCCRPCQRGFRNRQQDKRSVERSTDCEKQWSLTLSWGSNDFNHYHLENRK